MATSGVVAVLTMKRLCKSVTAYGFGAVPGGKAPYQVRARTSGRGSQGGRKGKKVERKKCTQPLQGAGGL
eukprot:763556-Pyramimonas_sp.AAC.3